MAEQDEAPYSGPQIIATLLAVIDDVAKHPGMSGDKDKVFELLMQPDGTRSTIIEPSELLEWFETLPNDAKARYVRDALEWPIDRYSVLQPRRVRRWSHWTRFLIWCIACFCLYAVLLLFPPAVRTGFPLFAVAIGGFVCLLPDNRWKCSECGKGGQISRTITWRFITWRDPYVACDVCGLKCERPRKPSE